MFIINYTKFLLYYIAYVLSKAFGLATPIAMVLSVNVESYTRKMLAIAKLLHIYMLYKEQSLLEVQMCCIACKSKPTLTA